MGDKQYIQLPDSTYAEFPADMKDEDIAAAIKKNFPTPSTPPAQAPLTAWQQGIQTQQNAANARWSNVIPTFLRNPVAGVAEAGNAVIQEGGALMAPLTESPVVGPIVKGAANLAGAAGKGLFNTAVQGGVDVGRSLGIPQFLQAVLPQSAYSAFPPAARQEAADKWNELGSNATAMALADVAPKVPGAVAKAVIPEGLPLRLYTSALKPKGSLADITKTAETGLREGIPVSQGGAMAAQNIFNQLNKAISDNIAPGTAAGDVVKVQPVIDALNDLRSKAEEQALPAKDLDVIDDAIDQFTNHPRVVDGEIPVGVAQKIKQGTYQSLSDNAYGEEGSASIEAQKTIARSLKEQLAQKYPELNNLNARDGAIIDLQEALQKRVAQVRKSSIWPGRALMEGLVGSLKTGNIGYGGALGATDLIFNNPYVLSKLGIALSKARGGVNPPPFIAKP